MVSLFTGYGGLDGAVVAVLAALGISVELVAVCDNDPGPVAILDHHHPDVPNLGDITTVDWTSLGPVHVLTGGFPCTDVSAAGAQLGLYPGTRSGLWQHMAYAIAQLRPQLVVIENVRGLLTSRGAPPTPELLDAWAQRDRAAITVTVTSRLLEAATRRRADHVHRVRRAHHRALGQHRQAVAAVRRADARIVRAIGAVLGDLAGLGFDAEWVGIRAADTGAPHGRYRVFILAWPANAPSIARLISNGEREPAGRPDTGGRATGDPDRVDQAGRPAARQPRKTGSPAGPAPDAGGEAGDLGCGPEAGPARRGRVCSGPHDHAGRAVPDAQSQGQQGPGPQPARPRPERSSEPPADAQGDRRSEGPTEPARLERRPDAARGGAPATSDPVCDGREGVAERDLRSETGQPAPHRVDTARRVLDWGAYEPAIRRWEAVLGRPAPAPTQRGARGADQLSPRFVEWMMGLPAGWVTDVPGLARPAQLKLLGNGVVPQQAEAALRLLLSAAR